MGDALICEEEMQRLAAEKKEMKLEKQAKQFEKKVVRFKRKQMKKYNARLVSDLPCDDPDPQQADSGCVYIPRHLGLVATKNVKAGADNHIEVRCCLVIVCKRVD